MPKVRTPVAGFTGVSAGVEFVDGVGQTDDVRALAYFRRSGYQIDDDVEVPPRAGRGSSLAAWQQFAVSVGVDPEGMSRGELVEMFDRGDL